MVLPHAVPSIKCMKAFVNLVSVNLDTWTGLVGFRTMLGWVQPILQQEICLFFLFQKFKRGIRLTLLQTF